MLDKPFLKTEHSIKTILIRFIFVAILISLTMSAKNVHNKLDQLQQDVSSLKTELEELSQPENPNQQTTKASWYDYDLAGSIGYSRINATAASNVHPRGSILSVCNVEDKCIEIRVNDFGPDPNIHPDRQIDLSSFAFQQLAPLSRGIIEVTVTKIN